VGHVFRSWCLESPENRAMIGKRKFVQLNRQLTMTLKDESSVTVEYFQVLEEARAYTPMANWL
jgi:hypothetical protein